GRGCDRARDLADVADPKIALGEGDFDASITEFLVDREMEIARNQAAFLDVRHIAPQLELEPIVAESPEEDVGLGPRQYLPIFARAGEQDVAHLCRVRSICDANLDVDAPILVAMGPVDDRTRQ